MGSSTMIDKKRRKPGPKKTNRAAIEEHAARLEELRSPTVTAEIPFMPTRKYAQRSIETSLGVEQALTLRAVLEGLEEQFALLNDGRVVKTAQDAIRWILEEIKRGK